MLQIQNNDFLFLAPSEGLACFGLYYLSLNGQQLIDGSLSTSLVLCDVNLDDTRPNREGKITRFMERRERDEDESVKDTTRSMIDITFRMKENDMFADVKVFSFNLILCVDFLLRLSEFLKPHDDEIADLDPERVIVERVEPTNAAKRTKTSHAESSTTEMENKAVFNIHIEKYDVILVEKMDDINCLALILNVSFLMSFFGINFLNLFWFSTE